MEPFNFKDFRIAIIGLGYVGLPLAIEFAKKYKVIGFDINKDRIKELSNDFDRTKEADLSALSDVMDTSLSRANGLSFSSDLADIQSCNIYIVTVPTPINQFKAPDLSLLLNASKMIGEILKKGDIVIYESTVYPGCTEEDCVPVLEKLFGIKI